MWSRQDFHDRVAPPAVGMIHLEPLPGSPRWGGDAAAVYGAAARDAAVLADAGFRAAMVENYHDVPFHPGRVPAETVAALTAAALAVREAAPDLALGINVLRNDVESALGVAAAVGASFVRVNVHVGAAATDQGPITGTAWNTLRRRRELAPGVGILADLRVKHARPLVQRPLDEEARDLRLRGLADAVIVTGGATGSAADPAELAVVREALPDCPLLVGSGATAATVGELLAVADGLIVGTSLQTPEPGTGRRAVDPVRAADFIRALPVANTEGPHA
jgi:membrane complex biogenesis BtpA family protein